MTDHLNPSPPTPFTRGYVQVYTGNGKGKTTAALGLALRAVGAGLRVYVAQFIKNKAYSEIKALRHFQEQVRVEQFGTGMVPKGGPPAKAFQLAREGLARIREVLQSNRYQMVILEEANVAVHHGLFTIMDLLALVNGKPESVEMVITGRYAAPEIIAAADLVTEMKEVKHYIHQGVRARVGIEK